MRTMGNMGIDRIVDIWGARTPHRGDTPWPVRVDQYLVEGMVEADVERWVRGACPCDYSGLPYAQLHDVGGVQWPCTADAPDGTERLYVDAVFPSAAEVCETYGHDLATGVPVPEVDYRALRPDGRALLKAVPYQPPFETPDERYPFRFTTGRSVYHWHTRTKTMRSRPLNDAAPAMWVEISALDADRLGVAEGDIVRVTSRRGGIEAPARISFVREGVIFAPWHYGDDPANNLTIDAWDPVSKQPEFKVAAVSVEWVAAGTGPAPAPTTTASAPVYPLDGGA